MDVRRLLGWLLVMMLLIPPGAAWAEERPSFVMAGLETDPYRDWQTNLFFSRMEEKTGVRFSFQQYADPSAWTRAKAEMGKDAAVPDVLFKARLTAAESADMLDRGVLIDLTPYLESCCPNLWAILLAHPEYLSAIALPDGRVAALPYIDGCSPQNNLWINERWLSALNLPMPTTAQELADTLAAFQSRDPNRNGRADEIPLGFLGPFDLKFLAHAFGLIANDYNVFAEDGQVRFLPLEENYRPFIAWCRELYRAGLLDKNGFSNYGAARQVTDASATATYGLLFAPEIAEIFQVSWAEDYGVLPPLTYEGAQVYRDFSGPLARGTFAVTTACRDPEAVLRWVDVLYGEEGAVLAAVGAENVDYVVDGDGTWRFTDAVRNTASSYISEALINDGCAPGIDDRAFEARYGENARLVEIQRQKAAVNAAAKMPFPYYGLTAAQAAEIAPLQWDIGSYVDTQLARWVLGEEEISDASFARFEQTLMDKGLPQFLAFWQNILDQKN